MSRTRTPLAYEKIQSLVRLVSDKMPKPRDLKSIWVFEARKAEKIGGKENVWGRTLNCPQGRRTIEHRVTHGDEGKATLSEKAALVIT